MSLVSKPSQGVSINVKATCTDLHVREIPKDETQRTQARGLSSPGKLDYGGSNHYLSM